MKIVRRTVACFVLIVSAASATGCTLGLLPRDPHNPALAAVPPCYAGDVCVFDAGGLTWMLGVEHAARH